MDCDRYESARTVLLTTGPALPLLRELHSYPYPVYVCDPDERGRLSLW